MLSEDELKRIEERTCEVEDSPNCAWADAKEHLRYFRERTVYDIKALLYTIWELQSRVAELEEVERKAIEQSEYIQSHGLTEYEMARLKARVAELETQLKRQDDAEIIMM